MKKEKWIIVVSFVVVFALGMAAMQGARSIEIMTESRLQEIREEYYVSGQQQIILEILRVATQCEPVTLAYGNQSYQLEMIGCQGDYSNSHFSRY